MDPVMEQLLIMAKTNKGKAVEIIITKILNQKVYKFGEFLNTKSIIDVSIF